MKTKNTCGGHAGRSFGRFDSKAKADGPKNEDGGDATADGGGDEWRLGGRGIVFEGRRRQSGDGGGRLDFGHDKRRVINGQRNAGW